jgi:hypothetical protein
MRAECKCALGSREIPTQVQVGVPSARQWSLMNHTFTKDHLVRGATKASSKVYRKVYRLFKLSSRLVKAAGTGPFAAPSLGVC